MYLKLPKPIHNLVKASKFWDDNHLILQEFKYFRKITVIAITFTLLSAIMEGVSIGLLLSFLQSLTQPDLPVSESGLIGKIVMVFLGENASPSGRLYFVSGMILLCTWMRAGFNYLAGVNTEKSQLVLADRLRKQIFEQLQALPLSYFTDSRSGEIVNTMTTEIERLKQVFSGVAFIFTRAMVVAVQFVTMFLISWQLSVISLFVFSLLAAGLTTLNRRVREASFGISEANGQFNATALELISGIRTIQAFGTQNFERDRFHKVSNNLLSASVKVVYAWTLVKPIAECIVMTVLICLIIVSYTQFTIDPSSLLTFFFVLVRITPSIQDANGTLAFLSTLSGSLENVKELLRRDNKNYFENGQATFSGLNRAIDIVSVDFGYNDKKLVLQNITLTIERGKMTALVGKSGSGKSTLADLIARFYDPTEGQIFVDGIDLRMLDINSLRNQMAVVSQDTFIFSASVRENIAYGMMDASDAEIREAARLANALDFIEKMPGGLDAKLGERGVNLSGGEKQRIAIARALLRNPEILILDEATAALDTVSERLIQESIEKLAVGRTVIAIAHRLSTIVKADKVVVMEGGQIIEQGSYQELLEQRGALWKYHKMQHESGHTA
ncbi:heterocyst formation ABC transporter subunit HepA [Calothrix sp. PCC 6303]|uniref:heterocyst formation ABC transporter subunit HepA n=1 Tax=Calothrix sp. PCC 6303 TaxID=1170562 RepID=UPI0002A04E2B|nr:heterocyst formation ABC transporter subunit HepA [Calothrix sp. PCC 6303]AFZ00863.1 Xenobiotic-transporting ATPase [Calothrix sp. PCC 6303]